MSDFYFVDERQEPELLIKWVENINVLIVMTGNSHNFSIHSGIVSSFIQNLLADVQCQSALVNPDVAACSVMPQISCL